MARKSTEKRADVAVHAHFDAVLVAEGHVVPPDRRAGLIAIYEDTRKQAAIVQGEGLSAAVEPANVFSLVPYCIRRADEA